jgi:hypothetical protein
LDKKIFIHNNQLFIVPIGDSDKIALSIEGGGMRGCVSAGASAALNILGIHDTIDVVYGRYNYHLHTNHVGFVIYHI